MEELKTITTFTLNFNDYEIAALVDSLRRDEKPRYMALCLLEELSALIDTTKYNFLGENNE